MSSFRRLGLLFFMLLAMLAVPAAPARGATFVVTTTADSGAGSLRSAIEQARSTAGNDTITFNIGGSPDANGVWKITLTDELPWLDGLNGAITIDGSTQPGGRTSGPNVYLDYVGSAFVSLSGLTITASGNTVRELGIINFTTAGILITGAGATNNLVAGSHIGLDSNGTTLAGNDLYGIRITGGATNNTIGGSTAADRNVVSGNAVVNITVEGTALASTVSGNLIQGNYVGTNAAGTAAVSNPGDGIELRSFARNNTVRGNVVVGHRANTTAIDTPSVGILISSGSGAGRARENLVVGNFVGTDPTGTTALPNAHGIRITNGADTNTIGSSSAADANLVSGNQLTGIVLQSGSTNANVITGNRIGLSTTGGRLPNGAEGIRVRSGASTNTIGPANIISGNSTDGVRITGSGTNGNIIRGNLIGTNPAGTTTSSTEANTSTGIRIDGGIGTVVGGTTAADGNVIAANLLSMVGIRIEPAGTTTSGHTISNNRIGVRSNGVDRLATSDGTAYGVLVNGSASITITSNIIGGAHVGIELINNHPSGATGVTNVRVASNLIGTNSDGTVNIANSGDGIRLSNGATGNTIGGSSPSDGNTIGRNGSNGIHITAAGAGSNVIEYNNLLSNGAAGVRVASATGIRITRTTTSGNTGDGIDLASGTGNGNMPAPTGLTFNAGPVTVSGNVNATACSGGCTVELFTSATQQNGEGPVFLRSISGVTGAFSIDATGCQQYVTATSRNTTNNNTSPFANPMVFTSSVGCAAPNISLTLTGRTPAGSGSVEAPSTVVYSYTLSNSGGSGSVSVATSQFSGPNWSGAPQSFGPYTLGTGDTQDFTVTVNVPGGTAGGTSSTHRVTATAGAQVVNLDTTTTVAQTFGVDIEPPRTLNYVVGLPTTQVITYSHTITNTGNGSDTISLGAVGSPSGLSFSFVGGNTCSNLAAGTSCTRDLRVTIPATPAASYAITVTATGGGSATDSVFNQAIGQAAAPALIPAGNRLVDVLPGGSATFTRTLQNVGNQAGTFSISAVVQAPTNGVTVTLLSPASVPLAVGESSVITLTTFMPDYPGAPISGTLITTLLSVVSNDGIATSGLEGMRTRLSPRAELSAATSPVAAYPLETAVFTHTLSNTSNGDDSYALVLTPTLRLENLTVRYGPDAGSLTSVVLPNGGPASGRTVIIAVPRGGARLVVVSARVQAGTLVSEPQSIDITAQTLNTPLMAIPPARTDSITVLGAAIGELSPAQARTVVLPGPLSYTRTITNSGNQAGDFSIGYTAPTGWIASSGILTPTDCLGNLAPGAACDFTVVVTPTANALAGAYLLRVTADVLCSPTNSSFVHETITGTDSPGVGLAPDRSASAAPDATVIYTHTLTNTGNVTSTFTLSTTAPLGWDPPIVTSGSLIDLPPGATRPVTVTLQTPPLIAAGGPFDLLLEAQVQGNPGIAAVVTDSTTIIAADAARLTPSSAEQSVTADLVPVTATYSLALRNSGNTTISYTLSLDPASLADGWTALVTPTQSMVLTPSLVNSIPLTVTVTAPAGVSGQQVVRLQAQAGGGGPILATSTLTTTVNAAVSDLLTPDLNVSDALPGETIIYTHTLRNIRPIEDTYLLSLVTPFGYEASVTPPSVTLAAGATRLVSVSIYVPTNVGAGTVVSTTVTATSASNSSITDSSIERTTILQVPAASLAPRLFSNGPNGTTVEFRHTLRNLGNARDSFDITAEDTLGWPITVVVPRTAALNVNATTQSIRIWVDVPANAPPGAVNRVTVRAYSTYNDQLVATVVNTIGLAAADIDPRIPRIYLPVLTR
ncbi:MAG TPA: NEW3 domain-containing protein [Roseiflexaceae bacterium]|nr:NEW3 domain-containing protein [Roseiflexaceae bacterium]